MSTASLMALHTPTSVLIHFIRFRGPVCFRTVVGFLSKTAQFTVTNAHEQHSKLLKMKEQNAVCRGNSGNA